MIVSSFAQQYGIRLHQEYYSISYQEYRQLLIGINGETALGQVVQIRAETDRKKINEMTSHEKKIRQEWFEFRSKQNRELDEKKTEQVQMMLKNLFGRG